MSLLAVDPGNLESAFVILDDGRPVDFGKLRNAELIDRVAYAGQSSTRWNQIDSLAIEMIASYGMAVGAEVFDTCVIVGRLIQAWLDYDIGRTYTLVYRKDVKLALCGSMRAKDSNVRAALIDRFGGTMAVKKGGVLHGVSADVWSALAVGIVHHDATAPAAKGRVA